MRSPRRLAGNAWPHEMVIAVDDTPHALLDLLWIREAWRLDPADDGDLPPALADPPAAVATERAEAPVDAWRDAWPAIWHAALGHAATSHDRATFDRASAAELGSAERQALMGELAGPTWQDRFGSEALTDGNREWHRRLIQRHIEGMRHQRDEQPEQAALDALVPAWRRGLTRIVQIPCRGTFTRVVGAHGLLVTSETRGDPGRYREALALFP